MRAQTGTGTSTRGLLTRPCTGLCCPQVRSWIVPVNRRHPLGELMAALRELYPLAQRKGDDFVCIEYVMLKVRGGIDCACIQWDHSLRCRSEQACACIEHMLLLPPSPRLVPC